MKTFSPEQWLRERTFHHSAFTDVAALVRRKQERQFKISLCFPTLNEEATIGQTVGTMVQELKLKVPLLDEVAVVDSGSTDRTRERALAAGADFYPASEILKKEGAGHGKGENLWKALYALSGDIIVYVDADISNLHPKFVYGLVGPLLLDPAIKFTKAFYERPLHDYGGQDPRGGGRVTEILVRPLFSQFFPELSVIIQPLSGEYAGYRTLFEQLPFPTGYSVDIGLLLDIYQKSGLDSMAQVHMDQRVHANQDTKALGRMAFCILRTFCRRLEQYMGIRMPVRAEDVLRQVDVFQHPPALQEYKIQETERQPMAAVEEYKRKIETQRKELKS